MALVLQRFDDVETANSERGFGAMGSSFGNLPLTQLVYRINVVGLSGRTTILQTYFNPFDCPIEATYIFPIEGQQAVVACEMRVADRVILAKLKERGEARAEYRRAIQRGYRAALLEENRPETFSMKVGNIPPGEAIQVCIETVSQLAVVHGEWTLRIPLVVAPRYTSGIPLPRNSVGSGVAMDTDQVPDASTVTPPTWLPGFASPIDLRLSVQLQMANLVDSSDWPNRLRSSLHAILLDVDQPANLNGAEPTCRIDILPGEKVDRDFVLRGNIASASIKTSVVVESSSDEVVANHAETPITFAIDIVPPAKVKDVPRDIVFLLDRSGSMDGWKIKAARRGMGRLVESLTPQDRFQVVAFDDALDIFESTESQ
jgi:Ca-activated chloride channel homolog